MDDITNINRENWMFADLHIHSKYSRATSSSLSFENLVKWAKIKGLHLLGTGDFTHPTWFNEIKEKLIDNGRGMYFYQDFPFIITGEISLIYTQGRGRRIHLVLSVPSIKIAERINSYLDTKGRRDYDGRPIFNISGEEFVREIKAISDDIEIIPAHCLLPNTYIHLRNKVEKIENINIGDEVITHTGRLKMVKEIYKRDFSGKTYRIIPWYFREGLTTTPEHPFYIIKSYKNCLWTKGLCKPLCSQDKNCKRKYYKDYRPQWVTAQEIEKGDFLVYPRFKEVKDCDKLKLSDFINDCKFVNDKVIIPSDSRNHRNLVFNELVINKDLCRLFGYYLSEGYLIGKEAIGFSFNSNEKQYIDDVISLVQIYFGVDKSKIDSRRENQADIIFYSKILNSFFSLFYYQSEKKSWNKFIPQQFTLLPNEKLAEILRGWWRGDLGCTVSRQLANQMKLICLKLGIIPSISIESSEKFNKKEHFINNRRIISNNDLFVFSNLSFFEEDYGMLQERCFKKSVNKIKRKHGWVDKDYVFLPVKSIEIKEYVGEVFNLEVENDNSYVSEFACVHNCWTPWFGLFGSNSGFDSLRECFGSESNKIHAIETGMSSSPEMNWKISELNERAIISFSDSHSFWPFRLGREATIFKKTDSYKELIRQIRERDFIATIETDPAYGKYHYDGHRLCNFSCSFEETKKLNGICPVCGKPLTIGVEYRVEELKNQDMERNLFRKEFYKLLPLHELIALNLNAGIESKKTWEIYNKLIEKFENEFNILLNVSKEELIRGGIDDKSIELILKNREGKIKVKPGYDGEYGVPMLEEKQKKLFYLGF